MTAFLQALTAFRLQHPDQLRAELAERDARVLGPLEQLQRDFSASLGGMHADGTFPDRRNQPRQETCP